MQKDVFGGHSSIHRTMQEFKELKKSCVSPLHLAKVTTERIIGRRKWARKRSGEWRWRREEREGTIGREEEEKGKESEDADSEQGKEGQGIVMVGGKRRLGRKRSIITDEDLTSPSDLTESVRAYRVERDGRDG